MKEQMKCRPRNYDGVPINKIPIEVRKRSVEISIARMDLMPHTIERLLRPFDREWRRYKKCG